MQQLERRSDRWVSTGLSVLLHGALIGALIYGWWAFRSPPSTPPTPAIDAMVVSSKTLRATSTTGTEHPKPQSQLPPPLQTVPAPAQLPQPQTLTAPLQRTPPPRPATSPLPDEQIVPPPQPKPVDHTAEQKAKQLAEQKAEAQAQRKAAERKVEQAAAERKAKEAKQRAEQQRLADAKRQAEEKRKAEQERKLEAARKAEQERRAAEAKALAASQAELAQGVNADERLLAERTGPAMTTWANLVTARITRAWIRPPTARPGLDCIIDITQVPGGQVVNVKVGTCNGDGAVRQSIQDAAYRASPLPQPSDPDLFQREFQVEFKPTE
ncbi:MAG: cell envelope integrity protein TolA [Steroidobacteraceae bacterium]